MKGVRFFELYFANLGELMLANLLFLPFNLLALGYAALTYKLIDGINLAAAGAGIVILNVGMSGISLINRYICTEKEYKVFASFKKGLKENALRFFVHGLIFYAVFTVSYLSIRLYYSGTKTNGFFWLPLVITAVIALFVLFASYYMNVMTVTMDISLKDTYRNCALFSFGELKNNFLATAALLILAAVIYTISFIVNNMWVVLIILAMLQLFLLPSTISFIITFYVYDDMVAILDVTRRKKDDEEEKKAPIPKLDVNEAHELAHIAEESRDEYIFYNGRMIKRSEVEKMIENSEE